MRDVMDSRKTSHWFSWTLPLALAVCMSSVPAYAKTHKGTLDVQFDGDHANLTDPIMFHIFDQGKIAGIEIPHEVNGMPFRNQEFTIDFNGCTGTLKAGEATLILRRKKTVDTFKAYVTNGAFLCLFNGTAIVSPWDPFTGNMIASLIGEASIWFREILDGDPDGNMQTNEQEILAAFGSSNHTRVEMGDIDYGHSGFGAPFCTEPIGKVSCNNGGSSSGILTNFFEIETK